MRSIQYLIWTLGWTLTVGVACHSIKTPLAPKAPLSESLAPSNPPAPPIPAGESTVLLSQIMPSKVGLKIQAVAQQLQRGQWQQAQELLSAFQEPHPAKSLLQVRYLRATGQLTAALNLLPSWLTAPQDKPENINEEEQLLYPLWLQEMAYLDVARQQPAQALQSLQQLMQLNHPFSQELYHTLLQIWSTIDSKGFLEQQEQIFKLQPADDQDGDSLRWAALAEAATAQQQPEQAMAWALQRYLQTPVSSLTPSSWPPQARSQPTPLERLERIERLVEGHRNQRAQQELTTIQPEQLDLPGKCRYWFALGLTQRKERSYGQAEQSLQRVTEQCRTVDPERSRRAHYLWAKVASIRQGIASMPILMAFCQAYPQHGMTDDVLFWAGDLYQGKQDWAQANRLYLEVEQQQPPGDHCSEARWRRAWISIQQQQFATSLHILQQIVADKSCTPAAADQARGWYWQGRISELIQQTEQAMFAYQQVHRVQPLGYYAQLTAARQYDLGLPPSYPTISPTPPGQSISIQLKLGGLAEHLTEWQQAVSLLHMGLGGDAVPWLMRLLPQAQTMVGQAHQVSLGLSGSLPPPAPPNEAAHEKTVEAETNWWHPIALLAWALDQAQAYQHAHWLVRTSLEPLLLQPPEADRLWLWKLAYPLAFRQSIEAAEQEQRLPSFFLQALAREESAYDATIVSWAEAYGLTQLLYSSGQEAGQYLQPKIKLTSAESLLDPHLNARLGGALLAHHLKLSGQHPAYALVAYNAGYSVASTYRKRFACQDLSYMTEQIGIQETRGYVKRVLRTLGIYRWLYEQGNGILAAPMRLPAAQSNTICAPAVPNGW